MNASARRYFNPSVLIKAHQFISSLPLLGRLIPKPRWHYPDWVITPHNKQYFCCDKFQKSLKEAKIAGGFDYRVPWRLHQMLWAADNAMKVEGDFVEVGTGKGFMMSGVLASIENWNHCGKQCYLYDLFQKPSVSMAGMEQYSKYYAEDVSEVIRTFDKWQNVHIVQGDIMKTLEESAPDRISLLHVDLNSAEHEIYAIRLLWNRIVPGAIIILDDYANAGLEEQYEAHNRLFEDLGHSILSTPSGQGIVVKQGS